MTDEVPTSEADKLIPPAVFDEKSLLAAPVRRAAYSDRTAWLMAAMSELAYFKFEGGEDFVSLATDIVSIRGANDVKERLQKFLREMNTNAADGRAALKLCLNEAGFDLVNVYNIADTQGFLARRQGKDGEEGMRILAFRGTEQKLADFKTDLNAELVHAEGSGPEEKIHKGFLEAFKAVRKKIEADLAKQPELPLYVTGHSLGGALAKVATRFIAGCSLGACYTFGSPRVGNLYMGLAFKTPIYRVVNSADAVPRTPPAFILPPLIALLKLFHIPDWIVNSLERFQGYTHFGDMRYLNHVDAGSDDKFANLCLIANPSLPSRAIWMVKRIITTAGSAALSDHSISLYRRKLKAYALHRN